MKRLAVIPTDPIGVYLNAGYSGKWLERYFNPAAFFDETYVFSPVEPDNPDLLGMKAVRTRPEELPRRLREYNIDVVRAYGGMWPCRMACENKASGIPVVVSIHDTNPELFFDAVKRADVVFCAQQLKDFVSTKFKDEKRIRILPNGISFQTMRPYSRQEAACLDARYPLRTKYRLLQVGRRHRQKNLETLVRALRFLGQEYSLLSAGQGEVDEYRALAQAEGVADRVIFIESIPNEEMALHFAWADCLAHPTRWEGMSLLIVEALASEAVVVASDIPEMKGLIRHGHNGLLVRAYEDPQALAETIRVACADEGVRRALKQNARGSVEQFEERKIRELEASYYENVLRMKEEGAFRTPLWKEWSWNVGRGVKRSIPSPLKRRIREALARR